MLFALVVLLPAGTTACTPKPVGPNPAALTFLGLLGKHKTREAADRTDFPARAFRAMEQMWDGLQAQGLTARIGDAHINGDTAKVGYHYEWSLPKGRVWAYDGALRLGKFQGEWRVLWTNTNLHPKLGDTQTVALRSLTPPRASVIDSSGNQVLVPGMVTRLVFTPKDVRLPDTTVSVSKRLADALGDLVPGLTGQSLAEQATAANGSFGLIVLRADQVDGVRDRLGKITGVSFNEEYDLVPTDLHFAPNLVGQVKKQALAEVDGKTGWRVVTVNADGVEFDVLHEAPAQPSPAITLSLDRQLQDAAQRAVDSRGQQAMMVAIQPSSGRILAVAQNRAADEEGMLATQGQYPPGSTFKIITASAAMQQGVATPESYVGCPGRVDIGTRTVPNENEFSLGTVPMRTAFAHSCNTTFAKLASEMSPDALTQAAASLGLGEDYQIPDLTTVSGSVPQADDLTVRTEDGFGQGKVTVSPFGMAVVAATVAHGSPVTPVFRLDSRTQVSGDRPALGADIVAGLRPMMRQVVTAGTATHIADCGEVYGKTGEAEVDGGSHAWFVGYRGDVAFATLIVRGGSSESAVAVTKLFLQSIPDSNS
ncbi:penicillin-binding protein transpeptidase [Segniliparus rotundus DSM 44985]|uniref:Penicillin-binding protein transpeptidase n=1 Tax=Segniliparus rotundus (strain ATCC BAA-972 / CDC 1076 / CIP 108378 / DSM 44985 / JCM 13578) TaxID=640132 RepID=D6ZAJ8_SEGRD|nr:penicillin-binding transpeptidase domain-containing protein [Segniliparus rotundus]ADG98734.1 penicillin-binding protein transpeptidase [Segniliparus rotundus DSM 44985]